MTFRVGQTVEFIGGDEWICAEEGATAVIRSISSRYINIVWKRDSKWHSQGDGGYYPSDFKPAVIKNQQRVFSFMTP